METYDYLKNKIELIENNLNNLIEINQSLVKQNIKLSNALLGSIDKPKSLESTKELYYSIITENLYIIYGPKTFEVKDKIKELNGEWDKNNKSWTLNITEEDLKYNFTNIIHKQIT
jgi:hypothetical protein